jgi:hypothetical protein
MALLFVEHFVYHGKTVDTYYDTTNNSGVTVQSGTGQKIDYTPLPTPERAFTDGQKIKDLCNGTTRVACYATTYTPFFRFDLYPNDSTCSGGGGGGGCQLNIVAVNKTDESQTGANDGTITVNATSPNPIQYSLDNQTYQSSNQFINLSPGNYNAFAKDSQGCIENQPVTILAYSNPVQSFESDLPVVNINGYVSRWCGVGGESRDVVIFQRKDFTVISVTQAPTGIYVKPSTTLTNQQYSQALLTGIYVKTDKYEWYGLPTAYDGGNGFTVPTTYLGDDTTGFVNIPGDRTGYVVQVEITSGNNPNKKDVIVAEFASDLYGKTVANLSPYLRTLLAPIETYDFLQRNYADYNLGGSYTLRFREVSSLGNGNWFNAPYALYYTYAAIQLGEQYGGNMAAYVPYTGGLPAAKWLTDQTKPTLWLGLPFEMSFIFSEYLLDKEVYLEITPSNGSYYAGKLINENQSYIINQNQARLLIERVYNSNLGDAGKPLIKQLGVNRVLIPQTTLQTSDSAVIKLYYKNSGSLSSFNGSLTEETSPHYVDGDAILYDNGEPVMSIFSSGSNTMNLTAGHNYQIQARSPQGYPAGYKVDLIVTKGGVTIYQQTIAATLGNSTSKTGIIQPGVTYNFQAITRSTGADLPAIDIADNNPVQTTNVYFQQPITVNIKQTCNDPYVYLKWINSRGAWDYWRFGFNQSWVRTTSGSEQIERFISDWENDDTREDFVSRKAFDKLTLVAGQVDKDSLKALRWLSNSIKVQMLVGTNPYKWQTVIVSDGDFTNYETRYNSGDVKITITKPSLNIQQQ